MSNFKNLVQLSPANLVWPAEPQYFTFSMFSGTRTPPPHTHTRAHTTKTTNKRTMPAKISKSWRVPPWHKSTFRYDITSHKHLVRVVEKMRNSQPPRNPVDLHGIPSGRPCTWLEPGRQPVGNLEARSLQWSSRQLWAPAQGARAPGGNFDEGCSPHARQPPLNSSAMSRGSVQKSATVTSSRAIPSP